MVNVTAFGLAMAVMYFALGYYCGKNLVIPRMAQWLASKTGTVATQRRAARRRAARRLKKA